MRQEEAAQIDAIKFVQLLKERFPFLRRDTLQRAQDAICALIEQHSTNQQQWSQAMPGTSSPEAKKKRLGRCVQDPQLDSDFFLSFLISLLPAGKLVLSLDRTNWEHGDTPLNLLVLGVVLEGFTLPLVWVALDHGGCSDSATRERLVARLLKSLPAQRWKALVADREFVGRTWFTFLQKRKIRRVIRIRADSVVDGLRVDQWFGDIQVGKKRCLFEKGWVYGCVMQVVATRAADGDLIVLATDLKVWDTWAVYRLRWSIETSQCGCIYKRAHGSAYDWCRRPAPPGRLHLTREKRFTGRCRMSDTDSD